MSGDESGSFGDGGAVGEVGEAQDLVTHRIVPGGGGPGGTAKRVARARVDNGTAKGADGGTLQHGCTDANAHGQHVVVGREARAMRGVHRPQPGVVVPGVPEFTKQPGGPNVTAELKALNDVSGVPPVRDRAESPLDGEVALGPSFVVLVAGRGDKRVSFASRGHATGVARGTLPDLGEDAPGLRRVVGAELIGPAARTLVESSLESAGESGREFRREPPCLVARRFGSAPAGAPAILIRAEQGKDTSAGLGRGGGMGGASTPPRRSDTEAPGPHSELRLGPRLVPYLPA